MVSLSEALLVLETSRVQFEWLVCVEADQHLLGTGTTGLESVGVGGSTFITQIRVGDLKSASAIGWDPVKLLSSIMSTILDFQEIVRVAFTATALHTPASLIPLLLPTITWFPIHL